MLEFDVKVLVLLTVTFPHCGISSHPAFNALSGVAIMTGMAATLSYKAIEAPYGYPSES